MESLPIEECHTITYVFMQIQCIMYRPHQSLFFCPKTAEASSSCCCLKFLNDIVQSFSEKHMKSFVTFKVDFVKITCTYTNIFKETQNSFLYKKGVMCLIWPCPYCILIPLTVPSPSSPQNVK